MHLKYIERWEGEYGVSSTIKVEFKDKKEQEAFEKKVKKIIGE